MGNSLMHGILYDVGLRAPAKGLLTISIFIIDDTCFVTRSNLVTRLS